MTALPELSLPQLLALAAALGWASGLRLYLAVFLVGGAGAMGWVQLPSGLQVLQHPIVLGVMGLMLFIEFFADKIPGLDSLWDLVHTVIRIPAGAALAGAVFGGDQMVWATVAALGGGLLAATSHSAKTSARAAVNTSPEPFSNVGTSLLEDAMVPLGLWLAWLNPWLFLALLVVVVAGMIWLIRRLWRYLRPLGQRLVRIFSGRTVPPAAPPPQQP